MGDDKRPARVLCCRVGDPYHNGTRGSVHRTCEACGATILISPATIKTIREMRAAGRSVQTQCIECGSKDLRYMQVLNVPEIEAERKKARN